jgi:hypothetical protein
MIYTIEHVYEEFKVFPKDGNGDPLKNEDGMPIMFYVRRLFVVLTHKPSGEQVVFKHYKHRGRWFWADERRSEGGSVKEEYVIEEIARMAFGKAENKARKLVRTALATIPASAK